MRTNSTMKIMMMPTMTKTTDGKKRSKPALQTGKRISESSRTKIEEQEKNGYRRTDSLQTPPSPSGKMFKKSYSVRTQKRTSSSQ